jgi:dCMP deaminase
MNEAYLYASKSKDVSTQVGAVIVRNNRSIARGYNGPLRGADDNDPKIFEKPYKSFAMEHAERNAFFNCALEGVSTLGCTMYTTLAPCAECARAIVQCGIKKLVLHADAPQHTSETFFKSQTYGYEFIKNAGIEIQTWSGRIIIPTLRFNGKNLDWKYHYSTGMAWHEVPY